MIEHGECGSTKAVRQLLAAGGVEIDQLSDCQGQANALTERLANARTEALDNLTVELERRCTNYEAAAQALVAENAHRRTDLDIQLTSLRNKQDALNRKPLHKRLWGTLQLTPRTLQTSFSALQLTRQEQRGYRRLAEQAQEIAQLDARSNTWIQQHTQALREALDALQTGMDSTHFRGAIGEERVAKALRALDGDHHVLHDLFLQIDHPITLFDHTYRGAQLDHVVLGPMGIAVLETKNWSASYCTQPDLSDPYAQTARSSHLMRCLLREAGLETKVYAVLVQCNSLPPRPPDVWGKEVRPKALVGYLNSRKPTLRKMALRARLDFLLEHLQV